MITLFLTLFQNCMWYIPCVIGIFSLCDRQIKLCDKNHHPFRTPRDGTVTGWSRNKNADSAVKNLRIKIELIFLFSPVTLIVPWLIYGRLFYAVNRSRVNVRHRSAFTVHRSPSTVHRPPFSVITVWISIKLSNKYVLMNLINSHGHGTIMLTPLYLIPKRLKFNKILINV